MTELRNGEFYGQTNQTIHLNGITLTDAEYTHDFVDWHYHENAYFTFILSGNVLEGNKKEVYNCTSGNLLFHNWQEPHYNVKPPGYTRGFQIELGHNWLSNYDLRIDNLQGSIKISHVDIQLLIYKIVWESKIGDDVSAISIQALILEALTEMLASHAVDFHKHPYWVKSIRELLRDEPFDQLTLEHLSATLNIHPVHLSRDFSKYFKCNLGEYIRKLKIEKSLSLLNDKTQSLTEIAYACGFYDQSHFIRCFKTINGMSPMKYRKFIFD